MNKGAKKLAKELGISYSQALQQIRSKTHSSVTPYERLWKQLHRYAQMNAVMPVKQNGRVFLIQKEEYDTEYEEDEPEYDLETHTSFPDTENGLESAISWLTGEYGEDDEEEVFGIG